MHGMEMPPVNSEVDQKQVDLEKRVSEWNNTYNSKIQELIRGKSQFDPENQTETIEYLRSNPDQVTDYCYAQIESFSPGDNTGILELSMLIEGLLKKLD